MLNGMGTVRVCTHYRIGNATVDRMPYDITSGIEPLYVDMPGWSSANSKGELPAGLVRYIETIEAAVDVPISLVSLGPDRKETVLHEATHVQ